MCRNFLLSHFIDNFMPCRFSEVMPQKERALDSVQIRVNIDPKTLIQEFARRSPTWFTELLFDLS